MKPQREIISEAFGQGMASMGILFNGMSPNSKDKHAQDILKLLTNNNYYTIPLNLEEDNQEDYDTLPDAPATPSFPDMNDPVNTSGQEMATLQDSEPSSPIKKPRNPRSYVSVMRAELKKTLNNPAVTKALKYQDDSENELISTNLTDVQIRKNEDTGASILFFSGQARYQKKRVRGPENEVEEDHSAKKQRN